MNTQELKFSLPHLTDFAEYEDFKKNQSILEEAVQEVIKRHHLPTATLSFFQDGTNIVFAHGKNRVIKIFPPFHHAQFNGESLVLRQLAGKLSVKTPGVEYTGEISGWPYIVMSQLEGTLLETLWENMAVSNKLVIMHELGALIREVHKLSTDGLQEIDCHWEQFIRQQLKHCVDLHRSKQLPEFLAQQIPNYLSSIEARLLEIEKPVLLTGEYTPMNFLVKEVAGIWHIEGLIDFGDCMLGLPEYDLLGPGAFLIQGDKQLLKEFLLAYGYSPDSLTPELSHKLTALMLLHQYSNLPVQIRIKNWQDKVRSLKEVEDLVWGF